MTRIVSFTCSVNGIRNQNGLCHLFKFLHFSISLHFAVLYIFIWAPSSEFVSSSIPSWQILTAHAQPFRGARDLTFCLKVPFDSLLVWASSEGSGETTRMRRLAWIFAARIGDKYQIRLTRSISLTLLHSISLHSTICTPLYTTFLLL